MTYLSGGFKDWLYQVPITEVDEVERKYLLKIWINP